MKSKKEKKGGQESGSRRGQGSVGGETDGTEKKTRRDESQKYVSRAARQEKRRERPIARLSERSKYHRRSYGGCVERRRDEIQQKSGSGSLGLDRKRVCETWRFSFRGCCIAKDSRIITPRVPTVPQLGPPIRPWSGCQRA